MPRRPSPRETQHVVPPVDEHFSLGKFFAVTEDKPHALRVLEGDCLAAASVEMLNIRRLGGAEPALDVVERVVDQRANSGRERREIAGTISETARPLPPGFRLQPGGPQLGAVCGCVT